jgi:hypothetical protein
MSPDFVITEGVVGKRVLNEVLEEAHIPTAFKVSSSYQTTKAFASSNHERGGGRAAWATRRPIAGGIRKLPTAY